MSDLNGAWLGTYWQHQPVRFEMILVHGGDTISGNILDDDRDLGEALVTGKAMGRSIIFMKRYLMGQKHIVSYSGTLSRDGNSMQGEWSISYLSGAWEAHRLNDNLMAAFYSRVTKKLPITADK